MLPLVNALALAVPAPRARVALAVPELATTLPNILMILSDDHGHTDLGITGIDTHVDTPVLDDLAAKGARFEFGYSTAPQCVPSRAGLLSGRNQATFGLYMNDADAGYGKAVLPPREKVMTIAEHLKDAGHGYVTGMSGKWHLGGVQDGVVEHPGDRGFDEFMEGLVGSFTCNVDAHGVVAKARTVVNGSNRIDISADFAERFVARHRKDRFFYYWAPFGPHEPMLEDGDPYLTAFPKPHYAWYLPEENDRRHRALALVKAIDTRLGGILETLRQHALEESTLILFASDNGAPLNLHFDAEQSRFTRLAGEVESYMGSENVPLRGAKGFLWEGGIRVPMFAYWKGSIPPGQVITEPVTTLDLTATIARAAGVEIHEKHFEGQDLLPRLVGHEATVTRPGGVLRHFWTSKSGDSAVRSGDWKLRRCRSPHTELAYLFNITADPLELDNLVGRHQIAFDELTSLLDDWEADLPFAVSCLPAADRGRRYVRTAAEPCNASCIDPRYVVEHSATCYPGEMEGLELGELRRPRVRPR